MTAICDKLMLPVFMCQLRVEQHREPPPVTEFPADSLVLVKFGLS